MEVVLDAGVVVELVVVVLGVDDAVVELVLGFDEVEVLLGLVLVVWPVVVVVLVGSVAAAPPHGFGWQVPGPRSMPPFSRHARGVFTRHLVTPLARVWQHWIGSWRRWRPAEAGCTPARRRVQAMTP